MVVGLVVNVVAVVIEGILVVELMNTGIGVASGLIDVSFVSCRFKLGFLVVVDCGLLVVAFSFGEV